MSSAAPSIDLRPDHWAIVRGILRRYVPDRKVLAFGSRATWTAKDYSDLDLAIMGDEPLSPGATSALAEGFGESDLPFKVDVVDWAKINENFRDIIRRDGVAVHVPAGADQATDPVRRSLPDSKSLGMEGEWPILSLCEAGVTLLDCEHRTPPAQESGYPYVGIPQVKDGRIDLASARHITREHFDEWTQKSEPEPFDVVLSRRCNPGETGFVPKGLEFALGQNLVLLRANGTRVFKPFLRWLVRGPQWWEQVGKYINVGAVFDSLKCADIPEFQLWIPPIPEQRIIAHILGTLDDKIELNRRMNETLEEMARALFKSWFVDFDPVRAKMEGHDTGLPRHLADLFPDRLVASELGEIPEGWKVIPLDAIARFQNGLALQRFRPAQNEARLPVVKIAQLRAGEANSGEWASATIRPECIIEDGDVLFSWSGSLLVKTWCGGRAALNQHLFKVTSGRHPKWFYLNSLLSHLPAFRRIAQDKATTMGHIRRHHLTDALCVVPPDAVIAGISDTFAWLLERQVANELVGRTSVALRETLLPKLISGEIRVGDAEMALESVT